MKGVGQPRGWRGTKCWPGILTCCFTTWALTAPRSSIVYSINSWSPTVCQLWTQIQNLPPLGSQSRFNDQNALLPGLLQPSPPSFQCNISLCDYQRELSFLFFLKKNCLMIIFWLIKAIYTHSRRTGKMTNINTNSITHNSSSRSIQCWHTDIF